MKNIPAGDISFSITSGMATTAYSLNPLVMHTAYENELDEDGEIIMEMVTTNLNDAHELRMDAVALVGRTSAGRGPSERIEPVAPLYMEDRKLKFDETLLNSLLTGSRGHITGLTLANNLDDATNDIDIWTGQTIDLDVLSFITLPSPITKRLDTAWAAGSNQGGLDTGAIANNTYHVWLIGKSTVPGSADALFSLSAFSPTVPDGYDLKRRIGSIIRKSSAIILFTQRDDTIFYKTPIYDYIVSGDRGTAAITIPLTTPKGLPLEAFGTCALGTQYAAYLYLSSLYNQDDGTPGTNLCQVASGQSEVASGQWRVVTNSNSEIRSRVDFSNANTWVAVSTFGYTDYRGKSGSGAIRKLAPPIPMSIGVGLTINATVTHP